MGRLGRYFTELGIDKYDKVLQLTKIPKSEYLKEISDLKRQNNIKINIL